MPGEALYQVVDLSSVWVVADVPELDLGWVRLGAPVKVRIDAYPDKVFAGQISYIYPTLNAATRTVQVRVDLPNPGLLLKPAMFAQVELAAAAERAVAGMTCIRPEAPAPERASVTKRDSWRIRP